MKKSIITKNGIKIAAISSEDVIVGSAGDALDLIMSAAYEDEATRFIIEKRAITEDFFNLRTGIAGEITQKFVNYNMKLAIVGDFSGYESKALKDYIYECNKGKHLFFLGTMEEAVEKLIKV